MRKLKKKQSKIKQWYLRYFDWNHDGEVNWWEYLIPFVFILFAITFGIGYGGETGGFPILNRKYFGHAPMGRAHGFQMLGAGIGMALGGWVGGPIYDISGSYNWALAISVVASLGGAISIVLLESTSKLLIPDWKKAEKSFLETKTEAN